MVEILQLNGGEYGGAIGGMNGSGKITITGGIINATYTHKNSGIYSTIGDGIGTIEISGGTINCVSAKGSAIGKPNVMERIKITGGNIMVTAGTSNFSIIPQNERK